VKTRNTFATRGRNSTGVSSNISVVPNTISNFPSTGARRASPAKMKMFARVLIVPGIRFVRAYELETRVSSLSFLRTVGYDRSAFVPRARSKRKRPSADTSGSSSRENAEFSFRAHSSIAVANRP